MGTVLMLLDVWVVEGPKNGAWSTEHGARSSKHGGWRGRPPWLELSFSITTTRSWSWMDAGQCSVVQMVGLMLVLVPVLVNLQLVEVDSPICMSTYGDRRYCMRLSMDTECERYKPFLDLVVVVVLSYIDIPTQHRMVMLQPVHGPHASGPPASCLLLGGQSTNHVIIMIRHLAQ